MSEEQLDLPPQERALSGRLQRARWLGSDGPPVSGPSPVRASRPGAPGVTATSPGDDDGADTPGVPPRRPATRPLPQRAPGSGGGRLRAGPLAGTRAAEPVLIPRPVANPGVPSRGAFEPPPKTGEPGAHAATAGPGTLTRPAPARPAVPAPQLTPPSQPASWPQPTTAPAITTRPAVTSPPVEANPAPEATPTAEGTLTAEATVTAEATPAQVNTPAQVSARPRPAASVGAKPSWSSVLAATVRLWLQRRGRPGRRGWQVPGLAALTLVVVAAGVLTYVVSRDGQAHPAGPPASPTASPSPPAAVAAASAVRLRAARWVTRQVNRDAIVACDLAMCAMLHSSGFPAANLLPILPATSDPLGAELVMATAVVRSQFGSRLAGVYAPQVIARFGTGNNEVDVRVVPPAGAAGSRGRLAQARQEARHQGQELLTNQRLQASGQARTALTEGRVDSRLLAVLPVLAHGDAVNIIDFGTANPGAPPSVPFRSADLAAADPDHARTTRGYRHFLMSLLRGQDRSLYRAASITIARAAGLKVVRIEFAAPSP